MKYSKILQTIFAVGLVVATPITPSAKMKMFDESNYYEPGKYDCYGKLLEDLFVCTDLVVDAANHYGCEIKDFPNNHATIRYCFIKKSIIPKSPSKERGAAFSKVINAYYDEHASIEKSVIKFGGKPVGNYESGSYNCYGIKIANKNQCRQLFFDVAASAGCMGYEKEFSSRNKLYRQLILETECITKALRISSTSAFNKVFQGYYDANKISARKIQTAADELIEIPRTIDGHHRAKGFSNFFGSTVQCPVTPIIETRLIIKGSRRNWTAIDIQNVVGNAYYEILKQSRRGTKNLCLKKAITFVVKADNKEVFKSIYNHYETNLKVFLADMGQVATNIIVHMQADGKPVKVYELMNNSSLMRGIIEKNLNYQALSLNQQMQTKQLFFIYHNNFYDKCIVPARKSENSDLRTQAMRAGFFGRVTTTTTKYNLLSGRILDEKKAVKLDVKPKYVEQYTKLGNYFYRDLKSLLAQGYGMNSIQSKLAKDIAIMFDKYDCFGPKLNAFESSISSYADMPLKDLTTLEILKGFGKK